MDENRDLIAYLDEKFARIDDRFGEMQEQMDRRFGEVQDQIRHTNVVVEGLRSKIETVAEGHVLLDAKLDRIYEELRTERQQDRAEFRATIRDLRRRDDELEGRVDRLEAASG